ncbi:TPA: ABC transporter ATP-binding protein, partial [Streptococcus suis]|nr:ABC transporter ATP-binding protein [Streptococcus suis]
QTVGIVGKTGSGKTTLVRQFLRQYPIGQGNFFINHQSVLDFKRSSIEEKIGYVPQEHILFSRSVGENIALGKVASSSEEIEQAIATAAFSQDLKRMTDGLDTMIGERGVSISGGQKQRISIARAFLREPDLLILDDSLSAVDARTERQIIQNIQKERAGKTNVIVTHRLSAVNHADWVLVLDEGRIVEEGHPADLLAQRGWYYEQYQRQQSQEGGE